MSTTTKDDARVIKIVDEHDTSHAIVLDLRETDVSAAIRDWFTDAPREVLDSLEQLDGLLSRHEDVSGHAAYLGLEISGATGIRDDDPLCGWLCDYDTGDAIRWATTAEAEAGRQAVARDGGLGVIDVDSRPAYVDEEGKQ